MRLLFIHSITKITIQTTANKRIAIDLIVSVISIFCTWTISEWLLFVRDVLFFLYNKFYRIEFLMFYLSMYCMLHLYL